MGRIRSGEIKKTSFQLIERYPEKFSNDFKKNKEALNELNVISEKRLKNRVAGYITRDIVVSSKKPKE